jgi:SrtB family sortase
MQTPDNPDYYLKHSFEKAYSDYGVPYIDEACVTGISNNIVIYGHHMKNGSMFADLCKYTDKDFYENHKMIKFDTLSSLGEYEVVAVSLTRTTKSLSTTSTLRWMKNSLQSSWKMFTPDSFMTPELMRNTETSY